MSTEWTEADQIKAEALLRDYRDASVLGDREKQTLYGKPLVELYHRSVIAKKDHHPLIDDGLLADIKGAITQSLEVKEVVDDVADHVKETLVDKERVHPMRDTDELTKHRLSPRKFGMRKKPLKTGDERQFYDKHAYGLFLPWEDTPSCVVYTAQSPAPEWGQADISFYGNKLLPGDITEFRDQEGKQVIRPRYVMFYSISNITNELPGIRLGPELLGKLKGLLEKDLGENITYSTLSPIRSFPKWLHHELAEKGDALFTESEKAAVKEAFGDDMTPSKLFEEYMPIEGKPIKVRDKEVMEYTVSQENKVDTMDPNTQAPLFGKLRDELCLEYLATAKTQRRKKQLAQDDVADFHMSNGAYIGNIALQSGHAEWAKAGGLMVNYVYGGCTKENAPYYESGEGVAMDKQLAEHLRERHAELGTPMPNIKEVFEPQRSTGQALFGNGAAASIA